MGKIIGFPAAMPLRTAMARLDAGMQALDRQRDDLMSQGAALAEVRAALDAQVVRTDAIADLAAAIEAALARGDAEALAVLQARLQELRVPMRETVRRCADAAD